MSISNNCKRIMAFVIAAALILSVLFIPAPKEVRADVAPPSVKVLGATLRLEDGDNDGTQAMRIGIQIDNANQAYACAIQLTVGSKTYTVATKAGKGDEVQNKMHSVDFADNSVVYAVVLKNIPESAFYSDIGILGKAWDIADNLYTSDVAHKNVAGVVSTIADKFPDLNICIIGGSLYKNNGTVKLTAEDLSGYSNHPDPNVTSNPLVTPAPTEVPAKPDYSGAVDFSTGTVNNVAIGSTGNTTLNNEVVTVAETSGTTELVFDFPNNGSVDAGEQVAIVITGSCTVPGFEGFRVRLTSTNDGNNGMSLWGRSSDNDDRYIPSTSREFSEVFTRTATGNATKVAIKSKSYDAGPLTGLVITGIHVYWIERGAAVPTSMPSPTPVPTPTLTPPPSELDLSNVTFDNSSMGRIQNGVVYVNDTGNDTTFVKIPFISPVNSNEHITVVVEGQAESSNASFRMYVADGWTSGSNIVRTDLTSGYFRAVLEFTANDRSGNTWPELRIRGGNGVQTHITGLEIDSVNVYYTDRGALVPAAGATPTPSPTAAPTAVPTVAPPTATPEPGTTVIDLKDDFSGTLPSGVSYNEGTGEIVVESSISSQLDFNMGFQAMVGETVIVHITGTVGNNSEGFRCWPGYGADCMTPNNEWITVTAKGNFNITKEMVIYDKDGRNHPYADIITFKGVRYGANLNDMTISSVSVRRVGSQATATPSTPTPVPTATPVATAAPGDGTYKWVTTWGTAEEKNDISSDRMPQMSLPGTTVRQIIRVTTSGDLMKLRLSNQYGNSAVTINSLHVAKQVDPHASTIDTSTDTVVTVGGSESFTIPAHQTIETDGFAFSVNALENVAISAYFGSAPSNNITGHRGARATSYQMSGNNVSTATLSDYKTTTSWFFLADASIWSPGDSRAVVCFGDSITDGYGTDASYLGRTPDSYTRWGDYFAARLQANAATRHVSVINEGIGSNGMLGSYPTDAGKDRFQRDLLEHDGVAYCIILFGVNDLNKLGNTSKYSQMIPEYQKMVKLCHDNGILCYGAPILPFGTSDYYSASSEQVRTMINNWMRSGESQMDGIIDFESAVADPNNPINILEAYTHEDGLHPYDGYDVMANAIDLTMFE